MDLTQKLAFMTDLQKHWKRLPPGAALTHWAMTEPDAQRFPSVARPMPDVVDYRFSNGWVATGDLPCREALRAALGTRAISRPAGPFEQVFAGLDGADVDFSQFCHRPTLISRGFRCFLRAQTGGMARFRIATCGGVRLWLGTVEVAVFEPFTRNTPQAVEVSFEVPAGDTPLTLRLEDLHERDTTCFFSLTYLGGVDLAVALDVAHDPQEVAELAGVIAGLRTEGPFVERGEMRLVAEPAPAREVQVRVTGLAPFARGGLSADPMQQRVVEGVLGPDRPSMVLFTVEDAPAGCLSLDIEVSLGATTLTRHLGTTNLPMGIALKGDLSARKAQASAVICQAAGLDPTVAAVLASRGKTPARVAQILDDTLPTIEQRYDCSDFAILPLLRIWRDWRDTLAPDLQDRLRAAILGYRYWLDAPGDDVMWFWSENHVLCFHTAQLVAGGLFPDQVFANSRKTGAVLQAEARARLHRWFASIKAHGLCEWNSAAYYPIDLLALFTLYDMAPELRAETATLMDEIFIMVGLHTSGGVPAGTQGRCYEKELLAGPCTELGSVAAIAFGGTFRAGYDRAAGLFCLSDYEPPKAAAGFAQLKGEDWVEARYTQGLGHQGKLSLWKSAQAQLSTVSGLKTGQEGHQAQVLDVQLAAHPMARLWVNHPGELKVWGERRPSLLAGNHAMPRVAQYGPTGMMIYDLDRDWTDIGFTQVFAAAGAFAEFEDLGGWRVFRAGAGRVAVWCSRALEPVGGLYHGSLWRAQGLRTAWVVALPMAGESDGRFEARLGSGVPAFDPTKMRLTCAGFDGKSLDMSFERGLTVDGTEMLFAPLSPEPHIGWNGASLTRWSEI
jgi:hypothetical protein